MLNLLSNWKLYFLSVALIGALSLNVLQRYRIEKLEGALQICEANNAAMQTAINAAQELSAQQEKQLRLREQEAAKARAESLKRRDTIMATEIEGGCEGAIQFLIDRAANQK